MYTEETSSLQHHTQCIDYIYICQFTLVLWPSHLWRIDIRFFPYSFGYMLQHFAFQLKRPKMINIIKAHTFLDRSALIKLLGICLFKNWFQTAWRLTRRGNKGIKEEIAEFCSLSALKIQPEHYLTYMGRCGLSFEAMHIAQCFKINTQFAVLNKINPHCITFFF